MRCFPEVRRNVRSLLLLFVLAAPLACSPNHVATPPAENPCISLSGPPPIGDFQPAWNAAGDALVYSRNYGTLRVVDVATGSVSTIGPGLWPAWSPDGRRIAYALPHDCAIDLHLLDLATGSDRALTDDGRSYAPRWSSDGTRLAHSLMPTNPDPWAPGDTWTLDLASGARHLALTGGVEACWLAADSGFAFVAPYVGAARNGEIGRFGFASRVVTRLTTDADDDRMPAVSSDGSRIAWYVTAASGSGRSSGIYGMSIGGGFKTLLAAGGMWPAWSPDGARIAYSAAAAGGGPPTLWIMNADGSGKTQLTTP